MSVYFDTNIVHFLRSGLAADPLPQQDKARVVLSPITVLELVSQIAGHPDDTLPAVHALSSWADTAHVNLLAWTEVFLAHWVFERNMADVMSVRLQRVLRVCYTSDRADDELRGHARALSDVLEQAKQRKAALLSKAVRDIRESRLADRNADLRAGARTGLAAGLRTRVGAPDDIPDDAIAGRLPAYFEFHINLVERAVLNGQLNFFNRQRLNDHFDAEQLVFLADPDLHFFTADMGYRRAAQVEPRVHVLDADELRNPQIAHRLMSAEIRRIAQRDD